MDDEEGGYPRLDKRNARWADRDRTVKRNTPARLHSSGETRSAAFLRSRHANKHTRPPASVKVAVGAREAGCLDGRGMRAGDNGRGNDRNPQGRDSRCFFARLGRETV